MSGRARRPTPGAKLPGIGLFQGGILGLVVTPPFPRDVKWGGRPYAEAVRAALALRPSIVWAIS
jgi:hypothetical protein